VQESGKPIGEVALDLADSALRSWVRQAPDDFTVARVRAQMNRAQEQLELEPSEDGASRELAGLGL
jgi:hypothetical protein